MFEIWNNTMNFFYTFSFTILQLVFGFSNLEPARIVCVFFEAFSGSFILLELEMISFFR